MAVMSARRAGQLALGLAVLATAGGGGAHLAGDTALSHGLFVAATAVGIVASAATIGAGILKRRLGVDAVALLALVGTLLVQEYLAGAVVAMMLLGGRALEDYAAGRATRELTLLVERAPISARVQRDEGVVSMPIANVGIGETILVASGEVVPLDGDLLDKHAVLDESALTGEPMPVEHVRGEAIRSGVVNAATPFSLRTTSDSESSTYSRIVRLAKDAEAASSPFVRMADRYALWFLLATLVVAGLAGLLSGNLERAVAVLVIATPCPLILAAPVAIVSGLSRSARSGVVIKGGAELEKLAHAKVLLLDKTGTLTRGRPRLTRVVAAPGMDADTLLGLAAGLDQHSQHPLASALVAAARERGLPLIEAQDVTEVAGQGIQGTIEGRTVRLGKAAYAGVNQDEPWLQGPLRQAAFDGSMTIFVGLENHGGLIMLADPIRPDAAKTIRGFRGQGISRIVMLTGDRRQVADAVSTALGIDDVYSDCSPSDKVEAVKNESAFGATIMVGDGINDAPALATAQVGIAVAARGQSVSSEAAGVVLTSERIDPLVQALGIAHRSLSIASQSASVGIGLSIAGMLVAAAGYLPPTWGALAQEGIDLAVILNALRVLRTPKSRLSFSQETVELAGKLEAEHRQLQAGIDNILSLASALDSMDPPERVAKLEECGSFLQERIVPHERTENDVLYPALDVAMGNDGATAVMAREHAEIFSLTRRLRLVAEALAEEPSDRASLAEARQVLYSLHAILKLHFEQEEENYFSLDELAGSKDRDHPDPGSS